MIKLLGEVRLRPTRIGFLVSPYDHASVRTIMRTNVCLWGGIHNPIIPIFDECPPEWNNHSFQPTIDITRGYIKFFEPEVFVESVQGMLEKTSLGFLRNDKHYASSAEALSNFFETEYHGKHGPTFGLNIIDVIIDAFHSERKFVLRDAHPSIIPEQSSDAFAELCMGAYPSDPRMQYLQTEFNHTFQPTVVSSNSETWLKIFSEQAITPLSLTRSHLESSYYGSDEPIIFIFDPQKTIDLIDAWNMRAQHAQFYPVPVSWLSDLAEPLSEFIRRNHRPLRNNKNGVMHYVTVEVSRSFSRQNAEQEILPFFSALPRESFHFKFWRTSIWATNYDNDYIVHPERLSVTANKKSITITIDVDSKSKELYSNFETLSPEFATTHSGAHNRWVNILTIQDIQNDERIALGLPFNTFNEDWLRPGLSGFINGREGWVFCQKFKDSSQTIYFSKSDTAFAKWFKLMGIGAELSEPGRIAKQMFESLGGFWGLNLFDDKDAIIFVNKIANRSKVKTNSENELMEEYSGRAAHIGEWQAMISKRINNGAHRLVDLAAYIERNVIRVGLETACTYCYERNWNSLDEISYEIKCSRCLQVYLFPQGEILPHNKNWKYRVIGPFAAPDYAQGAYASLLTIRFFNNFQRSSGRLTFTTAMNIIAENKRCEIDFALWFSAQTSYEKYNEPRLIIGEAKSFAKEAIIEKDIMQLQLAGEIMPNSLIVISVLKTNFSDEEKKLLSNFVSWAREPQDQEKYSPKHWVILLTGTELFHENFKHAWEEMPEPFSKYADYQNTRNLEALSNATLAIYLDLPAYRATIGSQP
ncbi:MAG: hypothetical protein V4732_02745 [Pseudomonadota bacterium]